MTGGVLPRLIATPKSEQVPEANGEPCASGTRNSVQPSRFEHEDFTESKGVDEKGRLCRYNDLPTCGQRSDHVADECDRPVQTELRFIEQHHAGQHFHRQVQQCSEGEETQR